jgi:succinate dehydrogenase/fumarate reductase flavoprotein subunit
LKVNEVKADILILGGGSAGCMAAIRAKELAPGLEVVVFEKGDFKRGGTIAMGMDALNIVAVPGRDTPETYVEAVAATVDGILDQKPSHVMAQRSFELMRKLEDWGVRFRKDADGNYEMLKIHPKGKFCAGMDEPNLKVILSSRAEDIGVRVFNRTMATSLLKAGGAVAGATGFNLRTGDFIVCKAKSTIITNGGCSRFTLPNSGHLFGTYDYPGNTGDGWSMAYRAGARLTGFEYTINAPLIKDIACPLLYITLTRGAHIMNGLGKRIDTDGDIGVHTMLNEFREGRGPVFIKLDHLPEDKIKEIEDILFTTERPIQKRFFEQRGIDFRKQPIELFPTEYYLCGGHGMTGLVVDENAATNVAGLFAAGDAASVPRQHLTGAFVFGEIAAESGVRRAASGWPELSQEEIQAELARVYGPLSKETSPIDLNEFEYKVRRIAGDYAVPPKNECKLNSAIEWMLRFRTEAKTLNAADYHELAKILEIQSIIDCVELSAVASSARKESRWGFYHYRSDFPDKNDVEWNKHVILQTDPVSGAPAVSFQLVERSVL